MVRWLIVGALIVALVALAGPASAEDSVIWRNRRMVVTLDQRRNDAIYTFTNRIDHPIRFACYWGTDGGIASYFYRDRLRPHGSTIYEASGTYTIDSMGCRVRRTDRTRRR